MNPIPMTRSEQTITDLLDDGEVEPITETLDELWAQDAKRTLFGMMALGKRLRGDIEERNAWLATVREEVTQGIALDAEKLAFLEEQIERLASGLLVGKSQHVDVPGMGRVQYRSFGATVKIADPEAFMSALNAEDREALVEMRPHLRTTDAKKWALDEIKAGALPEGVERVEARTTGTVTYT